MRGNEENATNSPFLLLTPSAQNNLTADLRHHNPGKRIHFPQFLLEHFGLMCVICVLNNLLSLDPTHRPTRERCTSAGAAPGELAPPGDPVPLSSHNPADIVTSFQFQHHLC